MDNIEKYTDIFKALSDPTRLKLVMLLQKCKPDLNSPDLCEGGQLCVNALAHRLGVTQSAVSQHLRVLRQAGIVRGERRGNFMHYAIDQSGLEKCKAAFEESLGGTVDIA